MRYDLVTWRQKISERMAGNGESFDDMVRCTLSDAELDTRFDDGFGSNEGKSFTLWTKARVYFPTDYDGLEGVRSVPRDPCDEATMHIGGGGHFNDDGVEK